MLLYTQEKLMYNAYEKITIFIAFLLSVDDIVKQKNNIFLLAQLS
jgi:hypothetical protein